MDTILGFFQSLAVSSRTRSHALFLLATGAHGFPVRARRLLPRACDHGPGAPAPQRRWRRGIRGHAGSWPRTSCGCSSPSTASCCPRRAANAARWSSGLSFAGLRSPNALPLFYAIKTGLALSPAAASWSVSAWLPQWSAVEARLLRDAGRVHRPDAAELRAGPHGRAPPEAAARWLPGCARPAGRLRRGGPRPHGGDPARRRRAEVQPPGSRRGVRAASRRKCARASSAKRR